MIPLSVGSKVVVFFSFVDLGLIAPVLSALFALLLYPELRDRLRSVFDTSFRVSLKNTSRFSDKFVSAFA